MLDRSYFALPEHDPAAFDHEPLKPYNVGPDALLVNFKSVRFVFAPDAATNALRIVTGAGVARTSLVGTPPPLAAGDCGDWRSSLGAVFATSRRRRR